MTFVSGKTAPLPGVVKNSKMMLRGLKFFQFLIMVNKLIMIMITIMTMIIIIITIKNKNNSDKSSSSV